VPMSQGMHPQRRLRHDRLHVWLRGGPGVTGDLCRRVLLLVRIADLARRPSADPSRAPTPACSDPRGGWPALRRHTTENGRWPMGRPRLAC
jgi:hypothetical protein